MFIVSFEDSIKPVHRLFDIDEVFAFECFSQLATSYVRHNERKIFFTFQLPFFCDRKKHTIPTRKHIQFFPTKKINPFDFMIKMRQTKNLRLSL